MNTAQHSTGKNLRIIMTIAFKDVVDVIKNKTTLTIILGVGLLMLSSQALPLLIKLQDIPKAYLYDPGESAVIEQFADQNDLYQLYNVSSEQELINDLVEAPDTRLGLVIPVDFDQQVQDGNDITLQGYLVHWADLSKANELVTFFDNHFTQQSGVPVYIQLDGNGVYPGPDSAGFLIMVSTGLVIVVITLGVILVPFLMIEEKETHTIEALLVSPASYSQIVLGKAIAGMSYCLVAAAVVLLINYGIIAQWGLMLLTVLCGSLFAVSLGLLLGTLFDNPMAMNLWAGLLIVILLVPVFLSSVVRTNWLPFLQGIFPWLPSVAFVDLTRLSFVETFFPLPALLNLVILVGFTLLLLALVAWRLRRLDR